MPIVEVKDQSILFLHVPKTGGSSIERHLQTLGDLRFKGENHRTLGLPCSPQHLHAEAIQKFMPDMSFDWAFMVVRHPVERIVSQYKYQTRKGPWLRKRWSFSVWLRYVLARRKLNPYYRDNHFRPQFEFEGFSAEVFRFEDGLDHCVESVNLKLGLSAPNKLVWEKRSQVSNAVVLSAADIELIKNVYRKDFVRYGYKVGV